MAGLINWRKKDYNKLRSAVSRFNNKVKRLEKSGASFVIPDTVSYRDLKSDITTRQEFNRMIKSLNSFSNKNATDIVRLDSGIEVTRWEKTELSKMQRTAVRNLSKELTGLTSGLGTGNTRINEINATLESLKGWKNVKSEDYKRIRNRIKYLGKSDLEMKQAKTFQANFIKAYKKMGRREIVEIAKSYNNPLEFWDFIKNSELTDISLSYDQSAGIVQLNMDADDTYYYELFKLGIT